MQRQIDGTLPDGHIYQLGNPGDILLSTGIPNLPIQMSASRLQDKSSKFGHDYDLQEVRDLVKAIHKPLAVFAYGDKKKAQNIIVPLHKGSKNFIVGLSLNPAIGGHRLEINSVRNIFPKDNAEWLNWIAQDKALYLDKEKIQTLIDQQRTNLADVAYLDLDYITNLLKTFKNPNGSERYRSNSENSSDSGIPSLDEITEAAESLAGTLGEKVRFVRDLSEIQEENPNILRRKRQSKGWYNSKT